MCRPMTIEALVTISNIFTELSENAAKKHFAHFLKSITKCEDTARGGHVTCAYDTEIGNANVFNK